MSFRSGECRYTKQLERVRRRVAKSLHKCVLNDASYAGVNSAAGAKANFAILRYFISWLNANVIGCVGMALNDLPASKSC